MQQPSASLSKPGSPSALSAEGALPVPSTRIDRIDPIGAVWGRLNTTQRTMLAIHGVILLATSYHGYKRNGDSVPWGLAWALGGLVCPTVTMGFALTQGYAKRASA